MRKTRPAASEGDAVPADEFMASDDPWEEVANAADHIEREIRTRYWLGDGCWQVRRQFGSE